MIKLNKHGLISKRLIAPEFTVGNTFVEGGGTPEELAVLSLTNEQLAALSYIVNGEGRIIPVGEDGTFDTKIGHSYCIRHTDDLTLHEAWLSNDENLYVKRYGSGQLLFFATSEKCKINDPSYIVTEVFRMAALNDFVDWSGIEHYQKWFKEIEVELTELLGSRDKFVLEILDGNTLVVHTDRADGTQFEVATSLLGRMVPQNVAVVQYNHNMEISWRDINKYAECKTFAQMYEVDPDKFEVQDLGWTKRYIINDLTSDGDFVYPLTSLIRTENGVASSFANVRVPHFSLTLPSATDVSWAFNSISYGNDKPVKEITFVAPLAKTAYYAFGNNWGNNLRKINCYLPLVTNFDYFASASLEEVEGDFSSASTGTGMFSDTRLNKKSALNVLTSIPAHASGSHPLTIGIHIDHQTDEEVLAAIVNAEEKGWTISVQWNGTPTSTTSTMDMGSMIYAKVCEHELPDGSIERVLDWGHYVTDETGYETFRSLESAYKYFGLENPETK